MVNAYEEPSTPTSISALSIRQLREKLQSFGVNSEHCLEKNELVKLLSRAEFKVGRVDFRATRRWQAVESFHICPTGLQYEMDMASGATYARLVDKKKSSSITPTKDQISGAQTPRKAKQDNNPVTPPSTPSTSATINKRSAPRTLSSRKFESCGKPKACHDEHSEPDLSGHKRLSLPLAPRHRASSSSAVVKDNPVRPEPEKRPGRKSDALDGTKPRKLDFSEEQAQPSRERSKPSKCSDLLLEAIPFEDVVPKPRPKHKSEPINPLLDALPFEEKSGRSSKQKSDPLLDALPFEKRSKRCDSDVRERRKTFANPAKRKRLREEESEDYVVPCGPPLHPESPKPCSPQAKEAPKAKKTSSRSSSPHGSDGSRTISHLSKAAVEPAPKRDKRVKSSTKHSRRKHDEKRKRKPPDSRGRSEATKERESTPLTKQRDPCVDEQVRHEGIPSFHSYV